MACTPLLPLPTRSLYLQLQRLYYSRAERDMVAVEAHCHTILTRLGRDSESISRDTVKYYCKNARNLRLVRWGGAGWRVCAAGMVGVICMYNVHGDI